MILYRYNFIPNQTSRYVWNSDRLSDKLATRTEAVKEVFAATKDYLSNLSTDVLNTSISSTNDKNETVQVSAKHIFAEVKNDIYTVMAEAAKDTNDQLQPAQEQIIVTWLQEIVTQSGVTIPIRKEKEFWTMLVGFFGLKNVFNEFRGSDATTDNEILDANDIADKDVYEAIAGSLDIVGDKDLTAAKEGMKSLLKQDTYENIKSHLTSLGDYGQPFLQRNPSDLTYSFNKDNWEKVWLPQARTALTTYQTNPAVYAQKQSALNFYKQKIDALFGTDTNKKLTLTAINQLATINDETIDAIKTTNDIAVLAARLIVLKDGLADFEAYTPEQLLQFPENIDNPDDLPTNEVVPDNYGKAEKLYELVVQLPGAPKKLKDKIDAGVLPVKALKEIYTASVSQEMNSAIEKHRQIIQDQIIARFNGDPAKQQRKIDKYKKNISFSKPLRTFFVNYGDFGNKMKEWFFRSLDVKNIALPPDNFVNPAQDVGIERYFSGTADTELGLADTTPLDPKLKTKIATLQQKDYRSTKESIAHLEAEIAKLLPGDPRIAQLKNQVEIKRAFERKIAEMAWTKFGLETVDATTFAAFVIGQGCSTMDQVDEYADGQKSGLAVLFDQWPGKNEESGDGFMAGLVPPGLMRQLNKFMRSGVGKWLGKLFGFSTSFDEAIAGADYAYLNKENLDKIGQPADPNPDKTDKQQEQIKQQQFAGALDGLNALDIGPDFNTQLTQTFLPAYNNLPEADQVSFWKTLSIQTAVGPKSLLATGPNATAKIKAVRDAIFNNALGAETAKWTNFKDTLGLDKAFAGLDFGAQTLEAAPSQIIGTLIKPSDGVFDLMQDNTLKAFVGEQAKANKTVSISIYGQLMQQFYQLKETTKDADETDKFEIKVSGNTLALGGTINGIILDDADNAAAFQAEWKDGDIETGLSKLIQNIKDKLGISPETMTKESFNQQNDTKTGSESVALTDDELDVLETDDFLTDEGELADQKNKNLFEKAQKTTLLDMTETDLANRYSLLEQEVDKDNLTNQQKIRKQYLESLEKPTDDQQAELKILKGEKVSESEPEDDPAQDSLAELASMPGADKPINTKVVKDNIIKHSKKGRDLEWMKENQVLEIEEYNRMKYVVEKAKAGKELKSDEQEDFDLYQLNKADGGTTITDQLAQVEKKIDSNPVGSLISKNPIISTVAGAGIYSVATATATANVWNPVGWVVGGGLVLYGGYKVYKKYFV